MRGATEEQWLALFVIAGIWIWVIVSAIRLAWMKWRGTH
jgi:hypothetical protein